MLASCSASTLTACRRDGCRAGDPDDYGVHPTCMLLPSPTCMSPRAAARAAHHHGSGLVSKALHAVKVRTQAVEVETYDSSALQSPSVVTLMPNAAQ